MRACLKNPGLLSSSCSSSFFVENSRKTEDENEKEDEKEAPNRICKHALRQKH